MADNVRNEDKKETKQHAGIRAVQKVLFGNVITSDFFSRHWIKVLMLVILVMVYISNKYQCMTQMETIDKLSRQLDVVESERIRERSEYMSRIRESSMRELTDSLHPGLAVQEQPAYRLDTPQQ